MHISFLQAYAKYHPFKAINANQYSDIDTLTVAEKIKGMIELSGFRLDLINELDDTDADVITAQGIMLKFFDMIKK